jgi:hypothetical protein
VPALGGRTQDQEGAAWRSGPGAHLEKAISMCCAVSMEATRIHGFRAHIRASTGPAASEEVWKGKGREKRAKNRQRERESEGKENGEPGEKEKEAERGGGFGGNPRLPSAGKTRAKNRLGRERESAGKGKRGEREKQRKRKGRKENGKRRTGAEV